MVCLAAFIGVHTSFTDDEANVILQGQAIAAGHWVLQPPLPSLDPTGKYYATENVSLTRQGIAPLAKHLVYTSIVAGVLRLGGPAGVTGLSIAGCLLAALVSAWLARLYAPRVERAAFWVTGLASPMFFYGLVDTGQTVGAAGCATAIALAIVFVRRRRVPALIGAAAAMSLAVTAREEALVYAAAAGVASLMVAFTHRRSTAVAYARLAVVGLTLTVAGLTGRLADVALADHAIGAGQAFGQQASTLLGGNSWLQQLRGLVIAAAAPGGGPDPFSHGSPGVLLVTVGAFLALGYAAVLLRLRRPGSLPFVLLAIGTSLIVARTALGWGSPVAGLLPAVPILWVSLWALGRPDVLPPEKAWVVGTTVLFGAGVALSVYSDGGGLQWGGRYFLVALPAAVPVFLEALRRRTLPTEMRSVTAACLTVCSLAASWQMTTTLAATHRAGTIASDQIVQAATATDAAPGDGGLPIVVTTSLAVGQLWNIEDRYRMVRLPAGDMVEVAARLRELGIRRFVLASQNSKADERRIQSEYRVASTVSRSPAIPGFAVAVMASR